MLSEQGRYHVHFTPSVMPKESLRATFVQRRRLLDRQLDLLRNSVQTGSTQHTLLVGPRGIGKTHFVSMLFHEIRDDPELQDLRIAWLREEEWGVAGFLDLLLRILRALDDEEPSSEVRQATENLYDLNPQAAEVEAEDLLLRRLGQRPMLLIAENLDDLFHSLGTQGQHKFRAALQENLRVSILATSPSLFHAVSRQTNPFYGFFRVHHLQRLGLDEAVELVSRSVRHRGDEALADEINSGRGRARIRVLHHLAGGNHRIYSIFSQFLTAESFEDLVSPVLKTLDDLTPYYQSRIAQLAPLQRKIVEVLCGNRGATSVQKIARRCFSSPQSVSKQLTELKKLGYVVSESYGRHSYYELAEPLIRLSTEIKKSRGRPIKLFVGFLQLWFSRTELEHRLSDAPQALNRDERRYLEAALQNDEADSDPSPELVEKQDLWFEQAESGDFSAALETAQGLAAARSSPMDWFAVGISLYRLGRSQDSLRPFERSVALNPLDANFRGMLGEALMQLGQETEAIACFKIAGELDPSDPKFPKRIGRIHRLSGHHSEARQVFKQIADRWPRDADNWIALGLVEGSLNNYEAAHEGLIQAIEVEDPSPAPDAEPIAHLGFSMCRGSLIVPQLTLALSLRFGRSTPSNLALQSVCLSLMGKARKALDFFNRMETKDRHALLRSHLLWGMGRGEEALETLSRAGGLSQAEASQDVWPLKLADSLPLTMLGDRESAKQALEEGLIAFQQSTGGDDAKSLGIARDLLLSTEEADSWPSYLGLWLEGFSEAGMLAVLNESVAATIPTATSDAVSLERAQAWNAAWQSQASKLPEMELGLRLLAASVEYRAIEDPARLLALPKEEREILKPLLRCGPDSLATRYLPRIQKVLDRLPAESDDL